MIDKMNGDTPKTDVAAYLTFTEGNQGMGDEYGDEVVSAEFARALERENASLRTALLFYADEKNWEGADTGIGQAPAEACLDWGTRARAILEALR